MSFFSLFYKMEEREDVKPYMYHYSIDLHVNVPFNFKNYLELTDDTMISHMRNICRYFFINNRTDYKPEDMTEFGFGMVIPFHIIDVEDIVNGTPDTFRWAYWKNLNYNKKMIQYMIRYCNENNIALIFITTPLYPNYRGKLDNKKQEETLRYMTNIVESNSNVFYYNYIDDFDFLQQDFNDSMHLNILGAEKLTKKLDKLLIQQFQIQNQ
jgi:hypothetical protein